MIRIQSQTHARLPVYTPNGSKENWTLLHIKAAFLQIMLAVVSQLFGVVMTYSKPVDFFPGLWTDKAEFVGRHPYYRAVLVMQ